MQVRTAIDKVHGFSYMVDQLNLQSPLARRVLLSSKYMTKRDELQQQLDKLEQIYTYLKATNTAEVLEKVQLKLMQVRDINGTIERLIRSSVLNDIELYEAKHFCLLVSETLELLNQAAIRTIQLPVLDGAVSILDPEEQRIPHFYIYDAYSSELKDLRAKQKAYKQKADELKGIDEHEAMRKQAEELYYACVQLEDNLRADISARLHPFAKRMQSALEGMAQLDILIAQAQQAIAMGLCKPEIAASTISYEGLFNPQVKSSLQAKNKNFQPVSIAIDHAPCLITGANMSGKTVLLKSIALSQYLFQFGFFVPASQASIAIADEVLTSLEDKQEELKGLSSFASEMLTINNMLTKAQEGKSLLLLIDELARTTNPKEGQAIVNATIDLLASHNVFSIITTHYSGIQSPCKRLRVKGFVESKMDADLSENNINDYIDYSLIPDSSGEAPMEALRVAELLGVSKDLVAKARLYITAK